MPHRRSARRDESAGTPSLHRPAGVLAVSAPPAQAGRRAAVDPDGTVLGRDATSGLVLTGANVSRRHAVVRVRDGEYLIEDLGSTNGTLLNGEPVTGTRHLRDGDRLTLADVEVEFQLAGPEATPPPAEPAPPEPWEPEPATEPLGTPRSAPGNGPGAQPPSLRHELHAAAGFSVGALLLAIAGSVVGTVLASAAGTDQWGALAGAALGPVVSTTFSTRRAGEKGRVRSAAVAVLSAGALLITVTGFSVADVAAGESVLPGSGERPSTFPGVRPDEPGPKPGDGTPVPARTVENGSPGIQLEPSDALDCGTADVGTPAACLSAVTIKSTGTGRLHVTRVEVTGQDSEDFSAGSECADTQLSPGDSCAMTVRFRPSAPGRRDATLVVHQNIPLPDRGTRVPLTGTGNGDGDGGNVSLRVEFDPQGGTATVVSDPAGIQCPAACSATFAADTTVTLSVRSDQAGGAVGWEGCASAGDTCSIRLDEDRTVRARVTG